MNISRNTPIKELPEFLSVDEFARFFGIGKTTAYELVRSGEVASKRFRRRYFIPKSEVVDKRNAA